ncbi:MAG: hypothetical protein ACI9Y8_001677, partial [Candidatus Omnitrophota bacterium]
MNKTITLYSANFKKLVRVVSVITIFSFVLQDLGLATGGTALNWPNSISKNNTALTAHLINDIEIPYDLGTRHSMQSYATEKIVINIQDAHSSIDAQKSLAKLLENLVAKYDLSLIGVEGDEGIVDSSLVSSFPKQAVRKEVANKLLLDTKISAAEFYQIASNPKNIEIFGTEDLDLYADNINSYKQLLDEQTVIAHELNSIAKVIRNLETKVFDTQYQKMSLMQNQYESGDLEFKDYWQHLNELTQKYNIEYDDLKNLGKLIEVSDLESNINFDSANRQRDQLVEDLKKKLNKDAIKTLVAKAVEYKLGKLTPGNFHIYLTGLAREFNLAAKNYQDFVNYANYAIYYEEIDLIALLSEISSLEVEIREALLQTNDQIKLNQLKHTIKVLSRFLEAKLNSDDDAYYQANKSEFQIQKIQSALDTFVGQYNISDRGAINWTLLKSAIPYADKFYEQVHARNDALLSNLQTRMRTKGVQIAALVSGGFHSEGLSSLMQQNRISHMVVMPKFDNKEGERPYVTVITQKGSYLDASIRRDAQKEAIALTLASAVNNGMRFNEAKRMYFEAYRTSLEDGGQPIDLVYDPEFAPKSEENTQYQFKFSKGKAPEIMTKQVLASGLKNIKPLQSTSQINKRDIDYSAIMEQAANVFKNQNITPHLRNNWQNEWNKHWKRALRKKGIHTFATLPKDIQKQLNALAEQAEVDVYTYLKSQPEFVGTHTVMPGRALRNALSPIEALTFMNAATFSRMGPRVIAITFPSRLSAQSRMTQTKIEKTEDQPFKYRRAALLEWLKAEDKLKTQKEALAHLMSLENPALGILNKGKVVGDFKFLISGDLVYKEALPIEGKASDTIYYYYSKSQRASDELKIALKQGLTFSQIDLSGPVSESIIEQAVPQPISDSVENVGLDEMAASLALLGAQPTSIAEVDAEEKSGITEDPNLLALFKRSAQANRFSRSTARYKWDMARSIIVSATLFATLFFMSPFLTSFFPDSQAPKPIELTWQAPSDVEDLDIITPIVGTIVSEPALELVSLSNAPASGLIKEAAIEVLAPKTLQKPSFDDLYSQVLELERLVKYQRQQSDVANLQKTERELAALKLKAIEPAWNKIKNNQKAVQTLSALHKIYIAASNYEDLQLALTDPHLDLNNANGKKQPVALFFADGAPEAIEIFDWNEVPESAAFVSLIDLSPTKVYPRGSLQSKDAIVAVNEGVYKLPSRLPSIEDLSEEPFIAFTLDANNPNEIKGYRASDIPDEYKNILDSMTASNQVVIPLTKGGKFVRLVAGSAVDELNRPLDPRQTWRDFPADWQAVRNSETGISQIENGKGNLVLTGVHAKSFVNVKTYNETTGMPYDFAARMPLVLPTSITPDELSELESKLQISLGQFYQQPISVASDDLNELSPEDRIIYTFNENYLALESKGVLAKDLGFDDLENTSIAWVGASHQAQFAANYLLEQLGTNLPPELLGELLAIASETEVVEEGADMLIKSPEFINLRNAFVGSQPKNFESLGQAGLTSRMTSKLPPLSIGEAEWKQVGEFVRALTRQGYRVQIDEYLVQAINLLLDPNRETRGIETKIDLQKKLLLASDLRAKHGFDIVYDSQDTPKYLIGKVDGVFPGNTTTPEFEEAANFTSSMLDNWLNVQRARISTQLNTIETLLNYSMDYGKSDAVLSLLSKQNQGQWIKNIISRFDRLSKWQVAMFSTILTFITLASIVALTIGGENHELSQSVEKSNRQVTIAHKLLQASLMNQLASSQARYDASQDKVNILEEEYRAALQRESQSQATLAEIKQEQQELTQNSQKLQVSQKDAESKLGRAELKLKDAQSELERLQSDDKAGLDTQADDTDIATLQAELKNLRSNLDTLEALDVAVKAQVKVLWASINEHLKKRNPKLGKYENAADIKEHNRLIDQFLLIARTKNATGDMGMGSYTRLNESQATPFTAESMAAYINNPDTGYKTLDPGIVSIALAKELINERIAVARNKLTELDTRRSALTQSIRTATQQVISSRAEYQAAQLAVDQIRTTIVDMGIVGEGMRVEELEAKEFNFELANQVKVALGKLETGQKELDQSESELKAIPSYNNIGARLSLLPASKLAQQRRGMQAWLSIAFEAHQVQRDSFSKHLEWAGYPELHPEANQFAFLLNEELVGELNRYLDFNKAKALSLAEATELINALIQSGDINLDQTVIDGQIYYHDPTHLGGLESNHNVLIDSAKAKTADVKQALLNSRRPIDQNFFASLKAILKSTFTPMKVREAQENRLRDAIESQFEYGLQSKEARQNLMYRKQEGLTPIAAVKQRWDYIEERITQGNVVTARTLALALERRFPNLNIKKAEGEADVYLGLANESEETRKKYFELLANKTNADLRAMRKTYSAKGMHKESFIGPKIGWFKIKGQFYYFKSREDYVTNALANSDSSFAIRSIKESFTKLDLEPKSQTQVKKWFASRVKSKSFNDSIERARGLQSDLRRLRSLIDKLDPTITVIDEALLVSELKASPIDIRIPKPLLQELGRIASRSQALDLLNGLDTVTLDYIRALIEPIQSILAPSVEAYAWMHQSSVLEAVDSDLLIEDKKNRKKFASDLIDHIKAFDIFEDYSTNNKLSPQDKVKKYAEEFNDKNGIPVSDEVRKKIMARPDVQFVMNQKIKQESSALEYTKMADSGESLSGIDEAYTKHISSYMPSNLVEYIESLLSRYRLNQNEAGMDLLNKEVKAYLANDQWDDAFANEVYGYVKLFSRDSNLSRRDIKAKLSASLRLVQGKYKNEFDARPAIAQAQAKLANRSITQDQINSAFSEGTVLDGINGNIKSAPVKPSVELSTDKPAKRKGSKPPISSIAPEVRREGPALKRQAPAEKREVTTRRAALITEALEVRQLMTSLAAAVDVEDIGAPHQDQSDSIVAFIKPNVVQSIIDDASNNVTADDVLRFSIRNADGSINRPVGSRPLSSLQTQERRVSIPLNLTDELNTLDEPNKRDLFITVEIVDQFSGVLKAGPVTVKSEINVTTTNATLPGVEIFGDIYTEVRHDTSDQFHILINTETTPEILEDILAHINTEAPSVDLNAVADDFFFRFYVTVDGGTDTIGNDEVVSLTRLIQLQESGVDSAFVGLQDLPLGFSALDVYVQLVGTGLKGTGTRFQIADNIIVNTRDASIQPLPDATATYRIAQSPEGSSRVIFTVNVEDISLFVENADNLPLTADNPLVRFVVTEYDDGTVITQPNIEIGTLPISVVDTRSDGVLPVKLTSTGAAIGANQNNSPHNIFTSFPEQVGLE